MLIKVADTHDFLVNRLENIVWKYVPVISIRPMPASQHACVCVEVGNCQERVQDYVQKDRAGHN